MDGRLGVLGSVALVNDKAPPLDVHLDHLLDHAVGNDHNFGVGANAKVPLELFGGDEGVNPTKLDELVGPVGTVVDHGDNERGGLDCVGDNESDQLVGLAHANLHRLVYTVWNKRID